MMVKYLISMCRIHHQLKNKILKMECFPDNLKFNVKITVLIKFEMVNTFVVAVAVVVVVWEILNHPVALILLLGILVARVSMYGLLTP